MRLDSRHKLHAQRALPTRKVNMCSKLSQSDKKQIFFLAVRVLVRSYVRRLCRHEKVRISSVDVN